MTSKTLLKSGSGLQAINQELLSILAATKISTATPVRISFAPTIPEYDSLYAVVLDSLFTPKECAALVHAAEASSSVISTSGLPQWKQALVNVGKGRQRLVPDERDCGRILWDDPEIVEAILKRIKPFVPELEVLESKEWPRVVGGAAVKRGEVWRMTRLNERMRFLKYGPGQHFQVHCDGRYETPSKLERSYFTVHLYLNDHENAGKDLEGGATTFHANNMKAKIDVEPKIGRVLIFQQQHLLHSGEEVRKGLKLTMRTDIMYEKVGETG